jgi:hypothetical protein
MPDAKYQDDQLIILDGVDDPVLAHADPIEVILPLKLDRAPRPRADGKLVEVRGNPPLDLPREVFKLSAS